MSSSYLLNPDLPVIKQGWRGNPLKEGRFINEGHPFKPDFGKAIKWKFFSINPQREEKKNDKWRPRVIPGNSFLNSPKDMIVWLGHASFFIRLNGISVLIDPVFFNVSLIKREIGLCCRPEEIKGLNYILISHGHMDHLDKRSLKIVAENNPGVEILTGLKLDEVIHGWLPGHKTQAAGWYQEYKLEVAGLTIFYLPAYHWYKRGLFDTNKALWGSFMIRSAGRTIYFGADSGYEGHYKEIAALFPAIDYCIIGCGAYKPEFMMKDIHESPEQAVHAFHDLGGKALIPMHYGTYDLSDEPMGEPYRKLQELNETGNIHGRLCLCEVGEEILL